MKLNFLEKAAKDLFPINRSLTGDGNRFTLNYLKTRRTKQINERYFLNINQKYYFF
jgi:aminopeptidase-like protein